jgi:hypothetical protein
MRSLFLWGYVQKIILGILNHMPACPVKCGAYFSGAVIFSHALILKKILIYGGTLESK